MNYPTSDLQFLAQILVRTRENDQVTRSELDRLNQIATKGWSSPSDAPSSSPVASQADAALAQGATRV